MLGRISGKTMWNKLIDWLWVGYKKPIVIKSYVTCESHGHAYSVTWEWSSKESMSTYRLICMRCDKEKIDNLKINTV